MEKTNLVLAKLLKLAFEHGLSHWELSFEQLDLPDEYATFFYPCVHWLEEEGLIRVESYNRTLGGVANGSVSQIALTSLGMAVLGQESVVGGSTEKVSETVTKASEGKVDYNRIGDALGGFLGGFIKSVGG